MQVEGKNFLLHCVDSRTVKPNVGKPYCIITDPVWPNVPDGMFNLDCDPLNLLQDVLANFPDATRVVIVLRSDSDPRFLKAVSSSWPFFRMCCLPYSVPGYIGRKLGGLEVAYVFGEPVKSVPGKRVIPGLAPPAQPGGVNKGHPCARNIDHMRWLVEYFSECDEVVIDPFMGSGTIGSAAIGKGRHFIGYEINPEYFAKAADVLNEAGQQQNFFIELERSMQKA